MNQLVLQINLDIPSLKRFRVEDERLRSAFAFEWIIGKVSEFWYCSAVFVCVYGGKPAGFVPKETVIGSAMFSFPSREDVAQSSFYLVERIRISAFVSAFFPLVLGRTTAFPFMRVGDTYFTLNGLMPSMDACGEIDSVGSMYMSYSADPVEQVIAADRSKWLVVRGYWHPLFMFFHENRVENFGAFAVKATNDFVGYVDLSVKSESDILSEVVDDVYELEMLKYPVSAEAGMSIYEYGFFLDIEDGTDIGGFISKEQELAIINTKGMT